MTRLTILVMLMAASALFLTPGAQADPPPAGRFGPPFLAVSPDGNYALTLLGEYGLTLWNLAAKRPEWKAWVGGDSNEPKTIVHFAAFSPDAKSIIAWGCNDGRVRVLETATGKVTRSFAVEHAHVACLALSADGKLLLTGGCDGPLKLWNVADGNEIRTFQGGSSAVSLALSVDNKYALSGDCGRDSCVTLWDVSTGKELWRVEGHLWAVRTVAFSPDGRHVLSAGGNAHVKIHDLRNGTLVKSIQGGEENELWHATVTAASFTVTGRYVLAAVEDEPLKLWEVATGKLTLTFQTEKGLRHPIVPTPDGRNVLSTAGGAPVIWDIRSGEQVGRAVGPGYP